MKISQIFVYPVKSLRGCSVPSAKLTPQGLQYDRKYMLVRVKQLDDGSIEYVSLYIGHVDALCLFTTSLNPSHGSPELIRVVYNPPDGTPPSAENPYIDIPIAAGFERLEKLELNLHQSKCLGYDMGSEYEKFFTEYLGFQTKLVYVGDSTREVLGNIAPNKTHVTKASADTDSSESVGYRERIYRLAGGIVNYALGTNKQSQASQESEYRLHFSDCAPLLITSETSLEALNKAKPQGEELGLDMTKARPNIVLQPSNDGEISAFEEDYWGELEISSERDVIDPLQILLTANCGRCKSLNVDYKTGKQLPVNQHMLKRLADMKRRVDPGMGYSPIFGRYGFIEQKSSGREIKIGNKVEVSKRNEERTVFYWPGLSPGTRPK